MRTHIYKTCVSGTCRSKKDKSLGNIWGDPLHDIFKEDGRSFSKCSICGAVSNFKDPDAYAHQRYPYYNASTDQVFHDKSHERAYTKKNNLDAL